jgi:hypothetical protein
MPVRVSGLIASFSCASEAALFNETCDQDNILIKVVIDVFASVSCKKLPILARSCQSLQDPRYQLQRSW